MFANIQPTEMLVRILFRIYDITLMAACGVVLYVVHSRKRNGWGSTRIYAWTMAQIPQTVPFWFMLAQS